MRYENIPITHDDVKANKYAHVSGGSNLTAKIRFKDNGDIDADFSYSDSYCRKHNLGKFANKGASSTKTSSGGSFFGGGSSGSGSSSSSSRVQEEETQPEPLSSAERELLERDIESNKQSTPSKYILRVIKHYSLVIKLKPELDEEKDLKKRKIKEFVNFMIKFPIPEDSIEFFYTLGSLEFGCNVLNDDKLFSNSNVLLERMKKMAYENEENSPLNTKEVMNAVKKIGDAYFMGTRAYGTTLKNLYKDISKRGDADAFNELIELLVNNFANAESEVKKFRLPTSSKKEIIELCNVLTRYKNCTRSALNVKFKELKELILAQYSNDEELMKFVAMQGERELRKQARIYNKVKFISLLACVLLSVLLYGAPLVLWIVLYCTKLHDKIGFLKKGKEALKNVYELDGVKPNIFMEYLYAIVPGAGEKNLPENATSKMKKVCVIDIKINNQGNE